MMNKGAGWMEARRHSLGGPGGAPVVLTKLYLLVVVVTGRSCRFRGHVPLGPRDEKLQ